MPVKLNSSGGGSVTLTTPSTAVDYTATFPANTGNVVTDGATQTLTNKTLGGPLVMGASVITSGTAQVSTSGTNIDFTGIPSWVKRVTVMFNGVSTNGTSIKQIQLGDAGGFETTGYLGAGIQLTDATSVSAATITTGFGIRSVLAADTINGAVIIANLTGNTWVAQGALTDSSRSAGYLVGGAKALSDVLTQVRITTVGGTDTFDAGSINILYE
jgi:hypothetical protein